jgi:uncharacterized protein
VRQLLAQSKRLKVVWKFFGSIIFIYVGLCSLLFFFQKRLIFVPNRVPYNVPTSFNLPAQDVWVPVKTRSGNIERLHAWWIPHRNPTLGTIVHFHGNAGGMARVDQLYKLGFSVLLVNYRGYARSEGGFPSEAQVYEDAEAAWNYLIHDRQIPAHQIVIYGLSLGGAVAIDLATKRPEAKALIVQSTFTSMTEMGQKTSIFKFFPVPLILTQRFDSINKIKQLKIPIFIIHGDADTLVPVSMSQALYNAAPTQRKLVLIPGGDHRDVELSKAHLTAIQLFMERIHK